MITRDIDNLAKKLTELKAEVNAINLNYKSFWAWYWYGLTLRGWSIKY